MRKIISVFDLQGAFELKHRVRYPSSPPSIINPECLSHLLAVRQSKIFDRTSAELSHAVAVRLKNAVVFENGAVMTADGQLLLETLRTPHQDPPPSEPSVVLDRPVALLRKPGDSNYGHWLVECLPRITEFRKMFPEETMAFGVAAGPSSMLQTRLDSLSWYGVGEGSWTTLNASPTRVTELFLISSNSIHSHTHDFEGLRTLATLARRKAQTVGDSHRVYVRRPAGGRRKLLNEHEVLDVMSMHGFRVVEPETMSVIEQVRLFAGAKIVVGVSGAALTNTLFCNPGTKVLTMMPNRGEEYFFWDIANIAELDFSIMFGEISGENLGCHSDFSVDTNILDRWLTSIL